ncbi:hypothetical protein HK102_003800 [Quaeritorhiza haematococci]|nr:hypothetical protein HK102_003800 [Quaeritorhiza haematococci]
MLQPYHYEQQQQQQLHAQQQVHYQQPFQQYGTPGPPPPHFVQTESVVGNAVVTGVEVVQSEFQTYNTNGGLAVANNNNNSVGSDGYYGGKYTSTACSDTKQQQQCGDELKTSDPGHKRVPAAPTQQSRDSQVTHSHSHSTRHQNHLSLKDQVVQDPELALWTQTCEHLHELNAKRAQSHSVLMRINKAHGKIAQKIEQGKDVSCKTGVKMLELYQQSTEHSQAEEQLLSKALEQLSILIALKEATEKGLDTAKRKKRKQDDRRSSSSSSLPSASSSLSAGNSSSALWGATGAGASGNHAVSKKARMSASCGDLARYSKSGLSLQPGDQVAVKRSVDNHEWMLANVVRWIPENDVRYFFPAKSIIRIPKEVTKRNEIPPNTSVLALYPGTSCFYRAVVIVTPSQVSSLRSKREDIAKGHDFTDW